MSARTAYLLWSPGFARALVISTAAELAVLGAVNTVPALQLLAEDMVAAAQLALLEGAHALHWWSAIAMLASACCVLQIILTALSLGCSGLNALLGPVRPPLLAAILLLQAGNWHSVVTRKPENARLVALGTAISVLISLSPEITERLRRRPQRGGAAERAADGATEVSLRVAKVSCSVCEGKVRSVAEAHTAVLRCDVDIDRSLAKLKVDAAGEAAVAAVTAEVAASLDAAGYPVTSGGREATGGGTECERAAVRKPGSSCCAVQLTINALAPLGINLLAPLGLQGCAGFNTFLGPLRPFVRGATATFFAVRWASAGHGQPKRALVVATVLAALLTYMPEMLLFAGATALAPPTDGAYYLDVAVGSSGVVDALVAGTEEQGVARMLVQPRWGLDLAAIARRVNDSGFEMDEAAAKVKNSRASDRH
ncbi:hypothetical protein EMIHUDRAFT_215642 [Emiliania huxleyi CCMP1516]|uniref:HMA domain-containing protein n=2 Tax=Emiliania huxleyi TaxID=2903 RepID=A0A0D3IGQ4_EMIH1|nr:hypothetical protein EMIHUDRAFT_215642 [Emiliania huxleyi CCMP1516]EOD10439.1 hypothetical protein EMIHUDRAFT_215642 [Emiliania huxleyi CCMP1516]|eukprot:XP_005762868.1 hypothetical protein EMIHUDRAFT_215642 [Emiliania huxleyi CCMP1516]